MSPVSIPPSRSSMAWARILAFLNWPSPLSPPSPLARKQIAWTRSFHRLRPPARYVPRRFSSYRSRDPIMNLLASPRRLLFLAHHPLVQRTELKASAGRSFAETAPAEIDLSPTAEPRRVANRLT